MKRILLLLVFAAACGTREKASDTTATLPPPDTVKPAPPVDTTGATAAQTKTGATKAQNAAKRGDVIGRDSVIRMPLKTLPLPDTPRRPQDSAKVIGRDSVIRMPLKTLPLPDTTKTKRPD